MLELKRFTAFELKEIFRKDIRNRSGKQKKRLYSKTALILETKERIFITKYWYINYLDELIFKSETEEYFSLSFYEKNISWVKHAYVIFRE